MLIYTLESVTFHKQWHLIKPRLQRLAMAGFYLDAIRVFVSNFWAPKHGAMGLQPHDMHVMMQRWFVINKHTKGFSGDVALAAAKVNMKNFVTQRAGSTARPMFGLWAGLIAVAAIFYWLNWGRGWMVTEAMTSRMVLMRYEERLWWGGLVGRLSEDEWDFQICRPTGFLAYTHVMPVGLGVDNIDFFFIDELWQTLANGVFGWNVLTWHDLVGRFRGMGHRRGWGRFRMKRPVGMQDPWNVPVGWGIREFDACKYLEPFGKPFEW